MFRSLQNATGLSRKAGDAIREPDDLPEHRVEVHVFHDANAASAFVDGLSLAGNPNRLAWDWETGSRDDNRTVLVARLDEPRPAGATVRDCIPVVTHRTNRLDQDDFEASLRKIHAERDEAHRVDAEATAPLKASIAAAGLRVRESAMRWMRVGEATLQLGPEGIDAEFLDDNGQRDTPAIAARIRAEAIAAGFRPVEGRGEFEGGPYPTHELAIAAVKAFSALAERFDAIRREAWHAAFMETMRMTAPRRRFMAAAAEEGITFWSERNNRNARAGDQRIKAGEILALERAGWIRATEGHKGVVTPEGLEALAAGSPRPRP